MSGLGASVRIVPWDAGPAGHDPRSCYSELFWLPVAGPTAWCALRRSAWLFEQHPDGFELQTADLARSLGVGTQTGPHALTAKQIAQLPVTLQDVHDRRAW